MTLPIQFSAEASAELDDAAIWHDEQRDAPPAISPRREPSEYPDRVHVYFDNRGGPDRLADAHRRQVHDTPGDPVRGEAATAGPDWLRIRS